HGTPPAWWICRFCRDVRCVEDEGHVLFECVNDDLICKARTRAFRDMLTIHPPLEYVLPKRTDVWDLLRFFARHCSRGSRISCTRPSKCATRCP
ncbi:hypothetical protein K466DRAFT_486259, partial [Polyporus arcularius HHB13444]